ncbi:MAG TPA: AAA family ATPase [Bacteroidales bacterium]|nr:AAA family ATPase [Bacteroidales bacterium]HPR11999.1 AAA family ATPase [Bacteroidales bacterium]HRW86673.1 AAA family ATPase [Bacteroidales bacterium]
MRSPFKFLDSYTKDDRDIFFGRDREIEELYHHVFESKIMLVYGISGTGKSSLINCGLANKLFATDWLPLMIRRGGNINESLASAIRIASLTEQKNSFSSPVDFKKWIRSLYLDHYKPVFLIFDQFEELFIFGDREERRTFIHIIKELYESDIQCRMIFVMREEYMAGITEFERFIPTFFSNRVRIEKMSHRNALEVVKGPCKVAGINLEEGFAETLLEKLSPGSEDVELTYLQVFLDKIFRMATENIPPFRGGQGGLSPSPESQSGSPTLTLNFTLSLLAKTGNVSDLLGNFLDDQISIMDDPETAMTVLKAFVSGKGTKRPSNEQDVIMNIRTFGKDIDAIKIRELIQSFVKLRVLRDKDEHDRYELRHDALAEKVYEKFSNAEKELVEIKQFIENSFQTWQRRGILLSSDDLDFISGKDSLMNLTPDLEDFIYRSKKLSEKRRKVFKRLIFISAFAFLILLSTIGYALIERSRISQSIILAKESVGQFNRPVDRICLAACAWKIKKTVEAREALLKAFYACLEEPGNDSTLLALRNKYLIDPEECDSNIEYASFSDDGRFIYAYTRDSAYIWQADGTLFKRFPAGSSPLISVRMSSDGKYLGAVRQDSLIMVWDNLGHLNFTRKIRYNPSNEWQIFSFTPDNSLLVIADENDAELLNVNGDTLQTFSIHSGSINAVDVSADKNFIATAGSDSTIGIWYLNNENGKYCLYNRLRLPVDTIRSVDLSPDGKYALSACADGVIRITSINGVLAWLVKGDITGDFSNNVKLGFPVHARFNKTGNVIIFRSSHTKSLTDEYFMSAVYADLFYHIINNGEIKVFDYVDCSPDNQFFITTSGNINRLLTWDLYRKSDYNLINNYTVLQTEGRMPFFSPDGKYLYSVCGRYLKGWYIDVDSISMIASNLLTKWDDYL